MAPLQISFPFGRLEVEPHHETGALRFTISNRAAGGEVLGVGVLLDEVKAAEIAEYMAAWATRKTDAA